jgi:hypothetical protein
MGCLDQWLVTVEVVPKSTGKTRHAGKKRCRAFLWGHFCEGQMIEDSISHSTIRRSMKYNALMRLYAFYATMRGLTHLDTGWQGIEQVFFLLTTAVYLVRGVPIGAMNIMSTSNRQ